MSQAISIQQVYDELKKIEKNMVTKKDVEALVDTIEILSNQETMQQLAGSAKDIAKANVKEIYSVQDLLDEM